MLIETDARPVPGEPLPVPDTLSSLVLRRLDRLPVGARAALLVVSALSAPTVALVRRAMGGAEVDTAIAHAERARLLEVHGDHISFSHPLLASAVYASAAAEMRRDVHRRLADVIAAPEERVRHLAMAASQSDAEVARALDEASLLARRRGAPDAAGELLEQAARLTPPADAAAIRRRRTQAAEHYFHAGDRVHARQLLADVLAEESAGTERATVLHLLGQIRGQEESFGDAIRYLEEALSYAGAASGAPPGTRSSAPAPYSARSARRCGASAPARSCAASRSAAPPRRTSSHRPRSRWPRSPPPGAPAERSRGPCT